MTLEEMQAIAKVLSTADGGCSNCITNLIAEISVIAPEFELTLTGERWERIPQWAVEDDERESFPFISVALRSDDRTVIPTDV